MVKRKTALKIRKAHRYLGIFLGIQFLMWTISGLYFSWTDIDEIHGDQFRQVPVKTTTFTSLISPSEVNIREAIVSVELREIGDDPYYWINEKQLFDAKTGEEKIAISESEALKIAERHMLPNLQVKDIERIEQVGSHSEYRGRPLPAFVISYHAPENIKAYVSEKDGAFQTLRHRNWRIFDFLWMTHTMDYEGRDNFNTTLLRAFSLLGLITVMSGFLLWYISSPLVIKFKKRLKRNQ